MQVLNSKALYEYEGKSYWIVDDRAHMKCDDGEWRPAVCYVPTNQVEGAPNRYYRRQDDFLSKFKELV